MIVIDDTWEQIDDDNFFRKSPVQPNPEMKTYFQFFRPSTYRVVEVVVPTLNNIKDLEKIALGQKWITRKAKLQQYLSDNPNCIQDLVLIYGETYTSNYITYLKSPQGDTCYERDMITTDDAYRSGMSVIVNIETEEVLMKHFDNVVYNATKKGYTRLSREEFQAFVRDRRLNTILN
jgi:hypothetical protein